jgi:hypothetical protein
MKSHKFQFQAHRCKQCLLVGHEALWRFHKHPRKEGYCWLQSVKMVSHPELKVLIWHLLTGAYTTLELRRRFNQVANLGLWSIWRLNFQHDWLPTKDVMHGHIFQFVGAFYLYLLTKVLERKQTRTIGWGKVKTCSFDSPKLLDEEKSKHAGSTHQNGFGPAFLHKRQKAGERHSKA